MPESLPLVPLSLCAPGVTAVIRCIRCRGPIRRRLADMGMTRGACVEVVRTAPLGDPIELKVRGYHLCVRKDEALHVMVEVTPCSGHRAGAPLCRWRRWKRWDGAAGE